MAEGRVIQIDDLDESVGRCVQCGFCLPACPTYRIFEREESSPRGRLALMGAVALGEIEPSNETLATFGECVGCRACESVCPAGVRYEETLLAGRQQLAEHSGPAPWNVTLLLFLIRHPVLIDFARRAWRTIGTPVSWVLAKLPRLPQSLALLAAAPPPSPDTRAPSATALRVVLHRGCLMDVFWEGTNDRAVRLLRDAGTSADALPRATGCCGALHGHQGDLETARTLARRVIEAFELSGAEVFLNLAGGCSAFVAGYPHLLRDDEEWRPRAERVAAAVRDFASLMLEAGWVGPSSARPVTYQDSCHLQHGLKVWKEPRALLREIAPYTELPDAATCCGSAGVYNMIRPDVSNRLLAEKVRNIEMTGCETVIVSNPGCELQLRMGTRRHGGRVRVQHLVDYLAQVSSERADA